MNDPSFQSVVTHWMAGEAYRRFRAASLSPQGATPDAVEP
jgi:hypothetical protein